MEGFGFAAGAMMQMTMQSQHSHFCSESSSSSVSHQVSHSPSPVIWSSSPPAPEEKLDVCVDQFSATLKQKMLAEQLQNIKLALKAEDYNVNLLGQGSSVVIAQVTGLKLGPLLNQPIASSMDISPLTSRIIKGINSGPSKLLSFLQRAASVAEKASSIGLKSGEYGGKNMGQAPTLHISG
ncbi:hypothetical protein GYMLUDRAFT_244746 [Collybiopsis luxurians FD-317 M1]|uniref:Uncharacterized protein n=1 Tax=Collybiopsis luxurians FD-317 M1 TaxID=944289 RepID=A0A0D0CVF0_9AGAR|nr:hypothetical protein GYMLUDRAFT_244746 [Collybiopsis luxurians FD-317 M1]